MATASATPQMVAPGSDRGTPGETKKRSSMTPEGELQRKERSFQEFLELIGPVYLLPFVFTDKDGTCIYCILLTMVGLMGRLLPPAVAAMLPIVILPLGDVYGADHLAAEYLGPRVLTASILFALAFLGDETTVFFRLCLHVIERCAVRIQPLYFGMQFVVLALSLLLPSHLIVIFSTVFIDRFVTTMHNEIVGGDQRSVVRIQTASPSPSGSDDARRPRWRRRSSLLGPERRARSVSVVSEVASETSGTGSSVKQGRMRALPPTPAYQAPDMPRWGERRASRKTSFGAFSRPRRDVDDDDVWSRYLPVRRIRSFSVQNKPPSSILKHRPSPPPPSPLSSPSYQGTSPRLSLLGVASKTEEPEDNNPADALSAATSLQSSPSANVCPDVLVQLSAAGTTHASSASPPLSGSQRKAQPSGLLTPSGTVDASGAPDGCIALSSHRPSTSNVNMVSTPSPMAKCLKEEEHASPPAKFRPKGSVKHGHGHGRQATSPHKSRHRQHALSANKRHPELAAPHTLDAKGEAPPECRRTSAQKIDAEPSPPLAVAARADSMPELATVPELVRQPRASQPQMEAKQLEVRGVLKKRSQQYGPTAFKYDDGRSPERIAPSENGDLGVRAPVGVLTAAGSELPTSGRRSIQRTSMSDMKSPLERGSCSVATGAEQPALSVRVRALTTVARPAFIASAAYTAIFGNIASFNTLPVQKTVLVTLGCRDEQCPVNWLRWLAVSLPVAVICCAISWTCIYRNSLVNCDDSIDEQTHRDMSKCAYVRHKNMKRHTIREALLFYWLIGIPVASSAYATQHPGMFLEGPFLGLTLLVLSTAPGPAWRRCWSLRLLCWKNLCSRMPWDIILMLGSVMALSRTVEEYRLVEVGLAKLDDHFWAQRSAKASLFILVSVAAVLSEVVVGDSLARSMATTVVRVAVVTETPVSFYVVPVSLVACINVMLPVSLPLLVMREYLEAKCAQMLAYGVLLKCTAVVVIFISMNTVGLFVFQADQPPAAQAYVIRNATSANRTVTL